jgi:putative NADH-flavin reductase
VLSILGKTFLKYPFEDQAAQERQLEASDVDYTIVRPPRLTNGPRTGQYRVEVDGLPRAQKSIARADVADFMLKQISDPQFLRRGVYIAR